MRESQIEARLKWAQHISDEIIEEKKNRKRKRNIAVDDSSEISVSVNGPSQKAESPVKKKIVMLKTLEVQSLEQEDRNSNSDSNSDAEIAPAPLGIAFSQSSTKFETKYSIKKFCL